MVGGERVEREAGSSRRSRTTGGPTLQAVAERCQSKPGLLHYVDCKNGATRGFAPSRNAATSFWGMRITAYTAMVHAPMTRLAEPRRHMANGSPSVQHVDAHPLPVDALASHAEHRGCDPLHARRPMPRPLLPRHSRYDYVPLPERADYDWPGGKRMAVQFVVNYEEGGERSILDGGM